MQLWEGLCLLLLFHLSSAQEACDPLDNAQKVCVKKPSAILKTTTNDPTDHYYIGGLFGIHLKGDTAYVCNDKFRKRGLMNSQAFLWAINRYQKGLQNDKVTVGGLVFDSCQRKEETIQNIMQFEQCKTRIEGVDRRQLLAFVGPDSSSEASAAAALLKDMKITTISHAATSPELSDAKMYPFFLRTVPSDANDAVLLANIVKTQIKTMYVQLVYEDNAYGRAGMERFKKEAKMNRFCVVQSIAITSAMSTARGNPVVKKLLEQRTVRYVVVYATGDTARRLLLAVRDYDPLTTIAGTFIFLGTSSWGTTKSVITGVTSPTNNSIVVAHVTDSHYSGAVADFRTYWKKLKPDKQGPNIYNNYLVKYWEDTFKCKVGGTSNPCNLSSQSLADWSIDAYVPYTIMAVDAVIKGIYSAAKAVCGADFNLCSKLLNQDNRGVQIFNKTKDYRPDNVRNLFNLTIESNAYQNGDVSEEYSKYKLSRVVDGEYKEFGTYIPGRAIVNSYVLNRRVYREGKCAFPCTACGEFTTTPAPQTSSKPMTTMPMTTKDPTGGGNYTFVKVPYDQEITGAYSTSFRTDEESMTRFEVGQKWIIALGVLAGLGIVAVIIFEIYILYKLLGTRMGHRWRTMWLGQLLLFGIFLAYLTLFAYIFTPTRATCGITRFGVGVSYAICFAVLLVKLMVILTSKTSESTSLLPGDVESPNYLKGIYQFLMFMFAVGVQIVIDAQWLITVPPEAVKVYGNHGKQVWICNHYTWAVSSGYNNMTTFVRNEFENHVLSLVYVMFLILITTVLALKAHGIITNHRESVFIGIAAGFSIPIWLAWGLVGGLNKNHLYAHEFSDGCIAFGLFLTTTLILFAMFLPKVRQLVNMGVEGIYLEDDHETYYAGSVIMAPSSYKSKNNSVIYVNNQGIYSEPIVIGNGDQSANHLKHPGSVSTYSVPTGYMKKAESAYGGTKVLRVTGDLTGRKRPASDYAYPRSAKGTLTRSRSHQNIGAL